ncbi:hypothetical protein SAMN06272771_1085 [Streptomyces sp. Ag82_O1-12]|nr:hypothetical protein SAMN06272771_1085 [Streptomyces sp. Ag82_O1-12]SOD43804.1 hypothetical protein SAMN06272727_1076 [Streptomyces sp. Ag82_G6-1]
MQVSSRLATTGLSVLVFAFSGSVLLVVDVTTGRTGGVAAGAATFLVCVGLWGLLPRLVRRAGPRAEADGAGETTQTETAGGDGGIPAPLRHTVGQPSGLRGAAAHREASARHR